MTLTAALEQGAAALGLELGVVTRDKLLAYIELIAKWNKVYNLTAVRERDAMVVQHVLDSLAVSPHLAGETLIDVGAGAGLPGVPLAVLRPQLAVTLLDSSQKKASFLKQVQIELGLTNLSVVCDRAERFAPAAPYDIVVSRAFARLDQFITIAGHLCAPCGVLAAMKGIYPEAELAALPRGYRAIDIRRIAVPGLPAERHLILIQPLPDSVTHA